MRVTIGKGKYDIMHPDRMEYAFRFAHKDDTVTIFLPEDEGYRIHDKAEPLDLLREILTVETNLCLWSSSMEDAKRLLKKWEPEERAISLSWLKAKRADLTVSVTKMLDEADGLAKQIEMLEAELAE